MLQFKHTAQFSLRKGVVGTALVHPAAAQLPLGALVCNFDEDGPMDHDDVVTFFHGRSVHHALPPSHSALSHLAPSHVALCIRALPPSHLLPLLQLF